MILDFQKVRIAMGLRIGAARRDGVADAWLKPLDSAFEELDKIEEGLDRHVVRLAKDHPAAPWLDATHGLSVKLLSRVLAVAGSLDRFPTPAKLWRYMGLHVVDGRAPRKRRGEKLSWAPDGGVVAYRIASTILKVGGPYRELYDRKRADYEARPRVGPSECPFGAEHTTKDGKPRKCGTGHLHTAAMRYVAKRVIRDLWRNGRRKPEGEAIAP